MQSISDQKCATATVLKNTNETINVNAFLKHKSYTNAFKGLQSVSTEVLACLTTLETIFVDNYKEYLTKRNILAQYLRLTSSVAFPHTRCHPGVKDFFMKSFFQLRLQHHCRLMTRHLKHGGVKMQKETRKFPLSLYFC